MSWLDHFIEATAESEAPEVYFYWAGLSTISAIVKNNLFLNRFYYKLYPNIYVVLIGKSGLRKGIPISYSKTITSAVNNTRVISGRNSIQAIIRDLAIAYTLPDGSVIKDSIGYMVASEFATLLIKDPEALTILTDLYDGNYNAEWKNTLKGTGVETLKNVCLSMLGASNEVHFKDAVPINAIGGGFIARTFLITADEERLINPLTEAPNCSISTDQLIEELKPVSKLKGEFQFSKKGKSYYEEWYSKFKKTKINDTTGTIQRMGDHVLKIAMLISLSKGTKLLLTDDDIEEAAARCIDAAMCTNKIFVGTGRAALGQQTKLVLIELLKNPDGINRQKLLQKMWGEFDYLDLDRIVENLDQAKLIDIKGKGGAVSYRLTDKAKSQIQNFMEEQ